MRKYLCILLAVLCGCAAQEAPAPAEETAEPTPIERSDIADKTSEVISLLLFAQEPGEDMQDAKGVYDRWISMQEQGCRLNETVINKEQKSSSSDILCDGKRYLADIRFDEELQISGFDIRELNSAPATESTEKYEEITVFVGKFPKLWGILTVPQENSNAPVAVLVPDGFTNTADQSGTDLYFRRDLAHALAENGVASLRWETRLTEVGAQTLEEICLEDFASAVHMLERQPVNAARIICIAHGLGGTIAHSLVYSHYEITGGLVLIDPAYTDMLEMVVPAEEAEEVRRILNSADVPETISGQPAALLRQYDRLNSIYYLNYVGMKTLVIAGSTSEDWPQWQKLLKAYKNVTLKKYTGLDHSMRISGKTLSKAALRDITDWIYGITIR